MKKIVVLTLAVLTLVVCFASCGSANTMESVAKAATEAYVKPDFEKYDSYMIVSTADCFEKAAQNAGVTVEEYLKELIDCSSMKDYYAMANEEGKKEYTEKYGEYTYKVDEINVVEFTAEELTEFKDSWKGNISEKFGLDAQKVESVAKCTVKVAITGDKKTDTEENSLVLIQYDGKWKVNNPLLNLLFN